MENKKMCEVCELYGVSPQKEEKVENLCESCYGVLIFMKREAKIMKLTIEEYLIQSTKW